jgi:hypothetical protein
VEFDGFSLTEEAVADRGPARPGAFVVHRRKAQSGGRDLRPGCRPHSPQHRHAHEKDHDGGDEECRVDLGIPPPDEVLGHARADADKPEPPKNGADDPAR